MTSYRPRLEMSPLDVYCAACHAQPSEQCTTMSGQERLPHAPREKLAGNPLPCPSCGAEYGKSCVKTSGAISMYPHRARVRRHLSVWRSVPLYDELGLVTYRFVRSGGLVREFDTREQAVQFASDNGIDFNAEDQAWTK